MKARHERELALREALLALYPLMPKEDALAIAQRAQADTDPADRWQVYTAARAGARHRHTDYEARVRGLDADGRQALLKEVGPAIRAKLREWGGPDRSP